MRIYLQKPPTNEQPPRFCHLFIQEDLLAGWTLVKESGYQGSPGRTIRQHFATWEEAERALVKYRDGQLRRGYRVMFAQGHEPPGA